MVPAQKFLCDLLDDLAMPEVYQRIRLLMASQAAHIQSYTEVIEQDAMLADWLIQIAKSRYFGYSRPVSDLYQAINLLGLIQVQDLLLCNLCMRSYARFPESVLDIRQFWSCSIECGIAARSVAVEYRFPAGMRFFSLGLLHEIGHPLMFLKAPETLLRAIDECQAGVKPLDCLEKDHLGFDYAELGATVMKAWQLPEIYLQTARYHLQPQLAGVKFQMPAAIIGLAHLLCQKNDLSNETKALVKIFTMMDWKNTTLDELRDRVIQNIELFKREVMDILLLPLPVIANPTRFSA